MNKYVNNLTLPNGTNVLIKDLEGRTNLSNEIRRATSKETELEEANTHLRNDITTETNARKQSDTSLQQNINAEVSAREQADTALQQNINAEASAREQADTALQQNINAEASAREQADTALQTNIEKLKTYVTPEMFGAIGDGITDDTTALQEAINYVTNNQNINLVLTKKYLVRNIKITNYCHIDFNDRPLIATKNQTGVLLNIDIPFDSEKNEMLHDMFKNLLIDGNESNKYEWLFTVSCRSLHLNSVKIKNARSNGMQTNKYDGMTFDFVRIIGIDYTDNKVGLHINREDCHFNYIDINDFNTCLKITPNISVHIDDAHLWSGGGTGVVFDKGPGASINSLTLDSMEYGINFNSNNLGFSSYIGNLFFWNIKKFCFLSSNNLLFNNVTVGNIQLVGVDDKKINSMGLKSNFPIRILNGFNYDYGALYSYINNNVTIKDSVQHYFNGNSATASFRLSNVTPINRYSIGACAIKSRQINGKKYGNFKFIANDESEYYYGDVLSDGTNLYCDFYIGTPSKTGTLEIKLRYDLETYFE